MEIAIQVIWWVGLVWAVLATAILVKQVILLVCELLAIRRLAEITRDAAQGISRNSEQFTALDPLGKSAERLHEKIQSQAAMIGAINKNSAGW